MSGLLTKLDNWLHRRYVIPLLREIRVREGMIMFLQDFRNDLAEQRLLDAEKNEELNEYEDIIQCQLSWYRKKCSWLAL